MEANKITETIIGCAIEVHRGLGPGLLESAYGDRLCYELSQSGLSFRRQVELPIVYKSVNIDCGYRMDLVVENTVIVEVKAIENLAKVHEVQLLSYLRLHKKSLGLLINFHVPILKHGIRRIVNEFKETSASPRLCVEALFTNGEKL